MPVERTSVAPAGAPAPPAYVPALPPPGGPPPAGLLARLRARRAGARRATFGRRVVVEVAPGARLEIGEDVAIGERCRILVRGGTLRIGPRTVVGERCRLIAHAGIELGADVVLGDEVVVIDFDHRYDDVELPVRRQGLVAEPVRIGDGARVGPRAAIQRGVTIGERAEVGPLSVVTGAMSGGERVAGVPALSPSAGRETRGGSRSRRGR